MITEQVITPSYAIGIIALTAEEAISAYTALEDIITGVTAESIVAVTSDERLITGATLNMVVTTTEIDDLLIISEGDVAKVEVIVSAVSFDRASVGVDDVDTVVRSEAREAQLILAYVLNLILIT